MLCCDKLPDEQTSRILIIAPNLSSQINDISKHNLEAHSRRLSGLLSLPSRRLNHKSLLPIFTPTSPKSASCHHSSPSQQHHPSTTNTPNSHIPKNSPSKQPLNRPTPRNTLPRRRRLNFTFILPHRKKFARLQAAVEIFPCCSFERDLGAEGEFGGGEDFDEGCHGGDW